VWFCSKVAVVVLLSAAVASLSSAAVTSVQVIDRKDALNGESFGKTGPYETVSGRVRFSVDPSLPQNRIVADIGLAPKNKEGLVEFTADLYVLKPRNTANGNGTALVEISNRGGKGLLSTFNFARGSLDVKSVDSFGDRFLLEQGFTLVWIGWEFDLPPTKTLLRFDAPIAAENGKLITGLVRSEWIGDQRVETISLGDRAQAGYAVANPEDAANKLFVRDTVAGARTLIARREWKFTDATHVALNQGFTPGRIYEVVYLAKNPVVAGLGMAAVRDFVSFLKFGVASGGPGIPLADEHQYLKRAIGFGISQSGRFLREYLYDGFNEDELGRKVFDGVWAQVAGGGRGSFNQRFAQPSRDGHPFLNVLYPVDVPYFDEEHLLDKSRRAHVVPKLFLTNGAYEYWGRAASLIHTTADGKADAPPSPTTKIYFFAGSQHGAGTIPPRPVEAQNAGNPNDYRYAMRALLLAMQNWLKDGTEPPASVFPRLRDGQLTTIAGLKFPSIPGVHVPQHKREAYRLDFSIEPPRAADPFPTLVPQVDGDGNDLGGIRMPEIQVPLASYTGWNLRSAKIGAPDEMYTFTGSWIPFARTKAQRVERHDPRLSIEDRYATEQEYLDKIDQAAQELQRIGFVLETDLPSLHSRAAREWQYRQSVN
jgi:hypothetical protein